MKFNRLVKFVITLSVLIGTMSMSYGAIATDAKLQYNKGIDYYQLGQLEESVTCFKKAIELDPNYIDAYYNLGSLLEYMQQDEAALAVFKQILLRKPDDYEAVYKAAQLSKKIGEYEKAKMYLTLIPKDTMIGQQATQLAKAIDTANSYTPTSNSEEQIQENKTTEPQTYVQAAPENNSTWIYTDITSPTGIATDNEGNLFVAGFSDNTIYKIGPDNKKIVYIKDNKIDGPIGLALDSKQNIYVANYNKNNVLKISNTGEISELIIDIQNPYCIHITDNLLFVSSQGSNSVVRFKLNQ